MSFHAMGTEVTVLLPHPAASEERALERRAARVFESLEGRLSRFLLDSELSRLNRAEGPFQASPELFELVRRALGYRATTWGLFDPTLGAALLRAGYDRSFAPRALDRPALAPARGAPEGGASLALCAQSRTIHREGLLVDLGGVAKGHAVDAAARLLPRDAALDAGGDAMLRGDGPEGRGWLVDVEDPRDPARTVATLRVRDQAVATSAPNRRRWLAGGRPMHHLLDPRTGLPSASELAQVTVVAPTAELADVLAKVGFLSGAEAAPRLLASLGAVASVLVTNEGRLLRAGPAEVHHA